LPRMVRTTRCSNRPRIFQASAGHHCRLTADGKTILDQRMRPSSGLASLEKFGEVAVIHVFADASFNVEALKRQQYG
jgi:hypothetical protein